ncbi:MAG: hypothetical protein OM95_16815 [Bdellovibrio sp. ArHS]|uniref:TetR-like C-terminal domain-containing protein n=1 Tax=Bdellovibrio sp. ArHS TaxID=1569284 RepID=UPI000582A9D0|nr:TetR-like C-terminal domain-containing protein [Bdellovibrio sp. ArHS]KHD87010.1 MAG: hypothetical protein OM95_16815 [Bdellovibrio sp. ArHS]
MARPKGDSLTADEIVNRIISEMNLTTLDSLSMAEIAKCLGIKTPSLYSHFENLSDIKNQITLLGLRNMARDLEVSLQTPKENNDLKAFMKAYRKFAHLNPLLFNATQYGIRSRDPNVLKAAHRIVELAILALQEYRISQEYLIHAVRTLRSLLNGFINLELEGGFQRKENTDQSFTVLIDFTLSGLKAFK